MEKDLGDPAPILVVPVAREEARIGVRRAETGSGVRIRKTVSARTQAVTQALQRDRFDVKRVPVDRIVALADAPATRQEGDTLVVPVLEEVLVVEKRLRIKEEIHITRSAQPEQYAGTVVLRAEQVSVERFSDNPDPK